MTWILYHIGEVAVSDHNGLAAAEGSSSRNLGEYAVSPRSDLRSAATSVLALFIGILGEDAVSSRSDLRSAANSKLWISLSVAEGSSSRNLGEYAVSARSDLRSAANYAKAPVRSETEAKPWRSQ